LCFIIGHGFTKHLLAEAVYCNDSVKHF